MPLEIPKEKWAGKVREVTLGATKDQGGTRPRTLADGGEAALPFLHHEGALPHQTVLGLEVRDRKPEDWSPLLAKVWGEAISDPGAWAKAAEAAGADFIFLTLSPTQADGSPNTPANARHGQRPSRPIEDADGRQPLQAARHPDPRHGHPPGEDHHGPHHGRARVRDRVWLLGDGTPPAGRSSGRQHDSAAAPRHTGRGVLEGEGSQGGG